jgi:hypothetical protein
MLSDEEQQVIDGLYKETIAKLHDLGHTRKEIIHAYIEKLEQHKIDALRAEMSHMDTSDTA